MYTRVYTQVFLGHLVAPPKVPLPQTEPCTSLLRPLPQGSGKIPKGQLNPVTHKTRAPYRSLYEGADTEITGRIYDPDP